MSDLIYRDARPEDIPTILTLCHAGDARGADTPPLDIASLTDPRYRAAFDEISADPNHRLIVVERDNEIVGTLQACPGSACAAAFSKTSTSAPISAAMALGRKWWSGRSSAAAKPAAASSS